MNKKRKLSLSLSLPLLLSLSLLLSFVLSLSSSLSLSNADVLHTLSHTNAPAFTRHHRIQRQEGERNLQCSEKECSHSRREEKMCQTLSLSHFPTLLFLPLFFTFSLSLLFMSTYKVIDIWTHALLKEGCQCLNILLISSRTQSILIVSVRLSYV